MHSRLASRPRNEADGQYVSSSDTYVRARSNGILVRGDGDPGTRRDGRTSQASCHCQGRTSRSSGSLPERQMPSTGRYLGRSSRSHARPWRATAARTRRAELPVSVATSARVLIGVASPRWGRSRRPPRRPALPRAEGTRGVGLLHLAGAAPRAVSVRLLRCHRPTLLVVRPPVRDAPPNGAFREPNGWLNSRSRAATTVRLVPYCVLGVCLAQLFVARGRGPAGRGHRCVSWRRRSRQMARLVSVRARVNTLVLWRAASLLSNPQARLFPLQCSGVRVNRCTPLRWLPACHSATPVDNMVIKDVPGTPLR
jgi:hypothetical protein